MTTEDQDAKTKNSGTRGRLVKLLKVGIVLAAIAAVTAEIVYLARSAEEESGSVSVRSGRPGAPDQYNNFDVSNASIPKEEIRRGGPPRKGIPAITDPKFVAAKDAEYLRPDDTVVGVLREGIARAYPLRIIV